MPSTLIVIGSSAGTGGAQDAMTLAGHLRAQGQELGICLLQDAVLMACRQIGPGRPEEAALFVLGEDLRLRGLREADATRAAKVVDHAELVDLILTRYERVIGIF